MTTLILVLYAVVVAGWTYLLVTGIREVLRNQWGT